MKQAKKLNDSGQSLWLDNITRGMLNDGTLQRYIDEFSVTGLTANPTIYDHAFRNTADYDEAIKGKAPACKNTEELFFQLALEDLSRAADLFMPVHQRTGGVDGWVSLELSPLLAHDTSASIAAAVDLNGRAGRPNFFVKIPGTPEGLPAIEECTFHGVPINVTLLFSREQYIKAADAFMRGIERRIEAGLNPLVRSVASLFVSRWDKAVADKVPDELKGELRNKLGIAIARRTYKSYRELLDSHRWQRLANFGAPHQRLLWASTGAKDPNASDLLYVTSLAAPNTVNTMPDKTLMAFADHGEVAEMMPVDGGDAEDVIARFARAGIDCDRLAGELVSEGVESFDKSWKDLMDCIASKCDSLNAKTAGSSPAR